MGVDIIKSLESQKIPVRSRFAPAPTGYLHLGHVVSALYVFGITRKLCGEVLVRIEDHDCSRSKPEFDAAIHDDLKWLEMIPDRSPWPEFGKFDPSLRQSHRDQIYTSRLNALKLGGLIYCCDCTRATMTKNPNGEIFHAGICRNHEVNLSRPHGLRVQLPDESYEFSDMRLGTLQQNPLRDTGDLLVKDRHGNWTYHFSSTVDDLDQGINLIIRGEDLLTSTGRQLALRQHLSETPSMIQYFHHPLVVDETGRKLGKRFLSTSVRQMRLDGTSRDTVLGLAAFLAGKLKSPSPLDLASALELFSSFDHGGF